MKPFTIFDVIGFAILGLFCVLLHIAASPDADNVRQCPIPSNNVSVNAYFNEMNYYLKLLSVWEPSSDSKPDNSTFERSAKRLMKLGNSIDKATQTLEVYKGVLDDEQVDETDHSLQLSAKYIVSITAMVQYGKPLSDKYNYTTMNVQIIQGITSQYSLLFQQLFQHIPLYYYNSIGNSSMTIICSLTNTLDYLQSGAFTDQGKRICQQFDKNGSFDYQDICEINKAPEWYKQCNNSATAMYKYGLESGNLGKNQSTTWCSSDQRTDPCKYSPSCAFTYELL